MSSFPATPRLQSRASFSTKSVLVHLEEKTQETAASARNAQPHLTLTTISTLHSSFESIEYHSIQQFYDSPNYQHHDRQQLHLWLCVENPDIQTMHTISTHHQLHPLTVSEIAHGRQTHLQSSQGFRHYYYHAISTKGDIALDDESTSLEYHSHQSLETDDDGVHIIHIVSLARDNITLSFHYSLPHLRHRVETLIREMTIHQQHCGQPGDVDDSDGAVGDSITSIDAHARGNWVLIGYLMYTISAAQSYIKWLMAETESLTELVLQLSKNERTDLMRRMLSARTLAASLSQDIKHKHILFAGSISIKQVFWSQQQRPYFDNAISRLQDLQQKLRLASKSLTHQQHVHDTKINMDVSEASHRINEQMKSFSSGALILMTITLITGLWGMNCRVPFETGTDDNSFTPLIPFFVICLSICVVAVSMLFSFKFMRWL